MNNKDLYSRTLRFNLHKPEHRRAHEIVLAVEGSANAYIINAILQYADSARTSPEEKIAQEVVNKLMQEKMLQGNTNALSMTYEEVEPNYNFCG